MRDWDDIEEMRVELARYKEKLEATTAKNDMAQRACAELQRQNFALKRVEMEFYRLREGMREISYDMNGCMRERVERLLDATDAVNR